MIGRLRGSFIEQTGNTVMVDCGGVGYVATVSALTLGVLPQAGADISLLIYTQASENKIALYGFLDPRERELFHLLITVKNVGPSSAMGILSGGAGPCDIARKIADENVKGLTKLKGVGKKTAEMLVVELREKCELFLASFGEVEFRRSKVSTSGGRHVLIDEVMQALIQMGFRAPEAEKAVAEIPIPPEASLENLLKQALQTISR